MKIYLLIFALLISFSTSSQEVKNEFQTINNKIDSLRKIYIKDSRTTYFNSGVLDGDSTKINVETTEKQLLDAVLKLSSQKIKVFPKLLPDTALHGKTYGVVCLSVINNRTQPKQSAEMATQLLLGTPVKVLKKQGGWYLVQSPDEYISWVEDDGLALKDETALKLWKQHPKIVVTEEYSHVLAKPFPGSERVSDLVKGNILELSGIESQFFKVVFADGRSGYLRQDHAEDYQVWLKNQNPSNDNILKTAKTMMGVPYLWGGTSLKGMDCSGFVKTAFFLNGVILPRDASQQVLVGDVIDVYEDDTVSYAKSIRVLKPGDLMFFSNAKDQNIKARIIHVGFYLGNGEFLHESGMVKINSLNPSADNYAEWQAKTFVQARRYTSAIGKPGITKIDQHPMYQSKK